MAAKEKNGLRMLRTNRHTEGSHLIGQWSGFSGCFFMGFFVKNYIVAAITGEFFYIYILYFILYIYVYIFISLDC